MKVFQARRLNAKGLEFFWAFIDQCRINKTNNVAIEALPSELMSSDDLTEPAPAVVTLDLDQIFDNRFELAKYMANRIGSNWSDDLNHDVGFWAWIAVAYWSQFTANGVRRQEHYIPAMGAFAHRLSHGRIDYRHCARTPVLLFKRLGDDCKLFLAGPLKKPRTMSQMGDFIEQILSRQDIFGSDRILELLRVLYSDEHGNEKVGSTVEPKKKKLKNGKWSQSGRGSARRLVMGVLPRLKLTYNVGELAAREIIDLAGPEFQRAD
jgi:hypothetical protein